LSYRIIGDICIFIFFDRIDYICINDKQFQTEAKISEK